MCPHTSGYKMHTSVTKWRFFAVIHLFSPTLVLTQSIKLELHLVLSSCADPLVRSRSFIIDPTTKNKKNAFLLMLIFFTEMRTTYSGCCYTFSSWQNTTWQNTSSFTNNQIYWLLATRKTTWITVHKTTGVSDLRCTPVVWLGSVKHRGLAHAQSQM